MVDTTPVRAQSVADLQFDYTCPRGLRVRVRPAAETAPLVSQIPTLREQLDLLDPKMKYSVELVYMVTPSIVQVRLWSFPNSLFNAFLFMGAL